MTENQSWYDGIVAVDHFSTDGSFELLNSRKKAGRIIQMPWMNLHYQSMTAVLQCGVINPGDWVYFLDSQERVDPTWVKDIRFHIDQFEKDGVATVMYNRPILFRKTVGMVYHGNPHCFPHPIAGKVIDLGKDGKGYTDENGVTYFDYILIGKKNLDDTEILHGAKYYFYEISNQPDMFYGIFGDDILNKHKYYQQEFRAYLINNGIEPSLDGFIQYIKDNINNIPSQVIEYIDFEFCIRDAIRMKVLGQTRQEILNQRHNWSFKHYYHTKDDKQINTSYVGRINVYRRQKGMPELP